MPAAFIDHLGRGALFLSGAQFPGRLVISLLQNRLKKLSAARDPLGWIVTFSGLIFHAIVLL